MPVNLQKLAYRLLALSFSVSRAEAHARRAYRQERLHLLAVLGYNWSHPGNTRIGPELVERCGSVWLVYVFNGPMGSAQGQAFAAQTDYARRYNNTLVGLLRQAGRLPASESTG